MTQSETFLHTTHRTIAWFNKANANDELELSAPFQRNPVWTDAQKAYLIDTILLGLPIPELYMQDIGSPDGRERHVVVDGQQRIRSVLEFIEEKFSLDGGEICVDWRGKHFRDLNNIQKQVFFSYKFVVRILPDMKNEEIRKIFSRLNRNVVSLNEQELRNATYWGEFISTVHKISDSDDFWSESGVFSANDHRRMIDHEYISELIICYIHGIQNKKDSIDRYYQLYENSFESKEDVTIAFKRTTSIIATAIPNIRNTRWRKKSDFYTLFYEIAKRINAPEITQAPLAVVGAKIAKFGQEIDRALALEEDTWLSFGDDVKKYAQSVSRAASDKANRAARSEAFSNYVFGTGAEPKDIVF